MLDRDTGSLLIRNADTTKNPGTIYVPDRGLTPQEAFDGAQSGVSNKLMNN